MHLSRLNPEILAVLPTIESPHFTTVTILAQNANINFDYPSHKYWRRIDEVLTVLGENFGGEVQEGTGSRVRWVDSAHRERGPNRKVDGPLARFRSSWGDHIRVTYMDPPHTYDPPTWRSLTRDAVKG